MRLKRFAVRDFRKLAAGVEIDGIEPGLTVIVGDNEEGKSTLLKALQAAFFDRHGLTGKAIEDMMPFRMEGARPSIEVDFELAGTDYRLEKTFARNSAVSLEGGHGSWRGDAAEERLRELLGFSQPGRGPAGEQHRGLAGLLWVEQGRAFQPLGMNADSFSALRDAVEGEVGQVLGGARGQKLLKAVEERAGRYYTRTGREIASLRDSRTLVESLKAQCDDRRQKLAAYDEKVDRLDALRDRLARYRRDGVLAVAKAEADTADEDVRRLEAVEGRLKTATAQSEQARIAAQAAESDRKRRTDLVSECKASLKQAEAAASALNELEPERIEAERGLAEAQGRLDRRNRQRVATDAAADAARKARERADLTAELAALEDRLEQAEALHTALERQRRALVGIAVDDDTLRRLRGLSLDLERVRAALDAAAATVSFAPEADQAVLRDGGPVAVGEPVRIAEAATFRLQGFGAVEVAPGGQDSGRLVGELSRLEEELQGALRGLGQDSLAAAEAALRSKQELATQVERAQGELQGVAPDGVEHLREQVRDRRVALAAWRDESPALAPDAARIAEEEALTGRETAARAASQAEGERDAARRRHDHLRERWVEARAESRERAEAAAGVRRALEQARRQVTDEALDANAAAAAEALESRQADHQTLLTGRDDLVPERLLLEQQRAREAFEQLRERIGTDERQARDLSVELRALGQTGLAEDLERAEGECDIARRDLERTQRDAKAWKLLLETLRDAEHEAKETFLEPVRQRLHPYLGILFPDSDLRLDDALEIDALQRSGVAEPFASLSIGAREQLAVLTRLALADLLREKEQPALLILDDPLVNSDDGRFRAMALALRKAAAGMQIVVLTCHEARYETLGAPMVRLADCRA